MLLEDILDVLGVKLRHIHRFMPDNSMMVCIQQKGLTFLPINANDRKPDGPLRVAYEDMIMKIDYVKYDDDYTSSEIEKVTFKEGSVEYTFTVETMELHKGSKLLYRYNPYIPEYYFNQTFNK